MIKKNRTTKAQKKAKTAGNSKGNSSQRIKDERKAIDRKKLGEMPDQGAARPLDILENIETSYFELDLKGNLTYFNDIACRDLGYTRNELMGKSFSSFTKPENIELVQAVYSEIYRTGRPKSMINVELIKKDGSMMYIEQSASVIRNPSGEVIGFQGVSRDITERIRTERALKRSEEKYRRILETIEDGYYETDLKGNFTFFNNAGWRNSGYEPEELTGMNYRAYTTPRTAEFLIQTFNRVYETGLSENLVDYEVVLKNGAIRYHEISVGLLRDDVGSPSGFHILAHDITERKKAEESLKKSEEKYRTILDTMEEGLFETDLSGNYTFTNDAASRLVGYEREEMIGKNYRMCHSPETIRYLNEVYTRMYKTGKSEILLEYKAIRKDGSARIHQATTAFIRDHNGKIIGFRALVRDMTDRKLAEEALRKSEEKYRLILEKMEEGYLENDLDGNFTFVNSAACIFTGYSRDEFLGMNYRQMFTPEVSRFLQDVFTRVYNTGKSEFLIEYDLIHKDGSVRNLQANVALMREASGNSMGFRTLVRDITKRKQAEEALRKSEERYRSILETMDEMYVENDLKGKITFVNDAAWKLMGYNGPDELIERRFRKRHPPEMLQQILEIYARIYKTGKPEFMMDYEVLCKDGSIRIHEASVALMKDSTGGPVGFRTLARDVTERKKAEEDKARIEEQLVQAQKMESVGRLAGGVAHDFNNMLTVILGYAELIKARLPQGDPILTDMLEIEKAAGRSRDITRQLLAFSRKEIIAPRPVDLNLLIKGAQKTLPRLIGEDIDLRFYPGTDLWKIKVDPSQMEHVLINLAANARDAMPEGGKLTIETENIHLNEAYCKTHSGFAPGHYVLLGVSDDGVGMDRETMQHLFEPFFTTKEMGKGTGLGLATVYGIVKQNGGFINVYSEPGKGTSFKMYIPRSMEEAIAKEAIEETLLAFGTGTILLVEDDDMVRAITTEMLQAIGYTVIATGTPVEALSFFEREDVHIDLVLTDVVMPQMSGRELSEKIEALRPGVRVLFMSGYTTNVIAHRGVLDEGVYFIQKPFSMSDLARKVRDAVNER